MASTPPPNPALRRQHQDDDDRPATKAAKNAYVANKERYTCMGRIRLEVRAADIHLFVSSEPNYMANNIHYECFQQANKYAFKNKLVSYQAGKYNQYSQARNPEHVAGQPNTLFKYYPGISMINDDGLPTVPLNDIPSLVQKLYALYLPLRDGPFTPSGVTCQAVDVIDFAIVYSQGCEDKN